MRKISVTSAVNQLILKHGSLELDDNDIDILLKILLSARNELRSHNISELNDNDINTDIILSNLIKVLDNEILAR